MKTDNFTEILKHYAIHPRRIIRWGKVRKIEADEGLFALKETTLTGEQTETCFHTVRYFERQQLPAVTPIFPNTEGTFYVEKNGRFYYLMPWGQGSRGKRQEVDFFTTLALFHRATKRTTVIDKEMLGREGERKKQKEEKELLELEVYADDIERKRYFSPFELSVLTSFPLIYDCCKQSAAWFEEWEKQTFNTLKTPEVQCHGRPSPDHLILDPEQRLRFINMEHTSPGHPVHDAAWLFRSCMKERQWEPCSGGKWIKAYEEHNVFTPEDRALLKSRLLSPAPLFDVINKARRRTARTEPEWTMHLEGEMHLLEKIKQDIAGWPKEEQWS
ncbi:phosphotransferase [Salibacterium aidingense]|uniref:phosphotransferase n=1 Tax=Salibacterium aidingense TaxID=384933 RepID=UPI000402309E|nr:phosphotransferase [Salibacterium aidingense]